MRRFPLSLFKRILETPVHQWPTKAAHGIKHYLLDYPIHIVLQTVSACNLKCSHCFINHFGDTIIDGKKRILTLDEFKQRADRIIEAIKNASYFQFSTFEALMHKDIFRMMDYILAIQPKIRFPILTNAMTADGPMLERLVQYPLSEFTVSLDGMRKETVESFKTGASFEKIVDTIKKVLELNPKVSLQSVFVLQRNNAKELPDYVDFVNRLGVKTVYVNNFLSFVPEMQSLYLYTKEGNPEVEKLFNKTIQRAKANGQILYLPSMKPKLLGCEQCEILFIDTAGNVTPCDFLSVSTPFELFGKIRQGKPVIFGNIFEEDVIKIYRYKRFKDFRLRHRRGKNLPLCCSLCIDAYGLMCSHRKRFG